MFVEVGEAHSVLATLRHWPLSNGWFRLADLRNIQQAILCAISLSNAASLCHLVF